MTCCDGCDLTRGHCGHRASHVCKRCRHCPRPAGGVSNATTPKPKCGAKGRHCDTLVVKLAWADRIWWYLIGFTSDEAASVLICICCCRCCCCCCCWLCPGWSVLTPWDPPSPWQPVIERMRCAGMIDITSAAHTAAPELSDTSQVRRKIEKVATEANLDTGGKAMQGRHDMLANTGSRNGFLQPPTTVKHAKAMAPSRDHNAYIVHWHGPHRNLPMPWQHWQPWKGHHVLALRPLPVPNFQCKLPACWKKVSSRHIYGLLGQKLEKSPNPHLNDWVIEAIPCPGACWGLLRFEALIGSASLGR